MSRLINCGLRQMQKNTSSSIKQLRNFSDNLRIIMTGGLEKAHGVLKEESYFYMQNCDLITKIRKNGSKLKCENHISDWKEFEKVLDVSVDRSSLRESCSLSRHKNCWEEAFFLNEQTECCTKLIKEKLRSKSKLIAEDQIKQPLDF